MVLDAFRARLGSIIGGFDAAQSHRRMRGFRATRAHVNTLIAASGETITARARWLVRNNGYAANAVDAFANHVVGDGIKPSSKITDPAKKEELQKLWLAWTDEADAARALGPAALQRLEERVAASERRHSGEIRLCVEAGLPLSYLWRGLPARKRAVTLFGKLRVWDTESNNGVLIYLLLADHRIEIVADRGLREGDATRWRAISDEISAGLRAGVPADAIVRGIEAVSDLLAEHAPPGLAD